MCHCDAGCVPAAGISPKWAHKGTAPGKRLHIHANGYTYHTEQTATPYRRRKAPAVDFFCVALPVGANSAKPAFGSAVAWAVLLKSAYRARAAAD